MIFKDPILTIYFLSMMLSFIISFGFVFHKNKPLYIKYFFLYPTLSLIFFLNKYFALYNMNYRQFMSIDATQIIYNLSFILHYLILGYFIKINFSDDKQNNIFSIIFWCFLIIITTLILSHDLRQKNGFAYGITNTCLILLCIIYYQQLFKSPPTIILVHSPAFWIINGIFFGMATTIPLNFSGNFFFANNNENIAIIKKLGSLSYIIMHLFFIKAYLCIIRPNKVL